MAESRARLEWNIGSAILAMVHNANCAKPEKFKAPRDFNPLARREDDAPLFVSIKAMRPLITRGK